MADKSPIDLHLKKNAQIARRELRHRAHVYAKTKDPAGKAEAGDALEKAALALALATALYGIREDYDKEA